MLERHRDFRPNLKIIPSLPFEILSNIFLSLHGDYRNTSFDLSVKADIKNANSFITVAHVCRRWRVVAHETKALWRRITLGKGLGHPASLATSFFNLSHPLTIDLEYEIDQLSADQEREMNIFFDLLICNPYRIASLYLRRCLPDAAWKLLQLPLTNILEIEVAFDMGSPTANDEHSPWMKGNGVNLLGGTTSTLQKLSLTDYTWPRGSVFPSLTNLFLKEECHESDLSLDEFHDVMRSLSQTLRVLVLDGASPWVDDSSLQNFNPPPAVNRVLMRALEHIEVYPYSEEPGAGCPLLFLHKLSIPNIVTMIWDNIFTEDFYTSHDPTADFKIPPTEHFARVTSLVARARYECCYYVLTGSTFFVDSNHIGLGQIEALLDLVPHLELLALAEGKDYSDWENTQSLLHQCSSVKVLHLGRFVNVVQLIYELEKENYENPFLPKLETLTIYTGNMDVLSMPTLDKISRRLNGLYLEILDLSSHGSMVRNRPHLKSAYTLRFAMGNVEDLSF